MALKIGFCLSLMLTDNKKQPFPTTQPIISDIETALNPPEFSDGPDLTFWGMGEGSSYRNGNMRKKSIEFRDGPICSVQIIFPGHMTLSTSISG
jgi:hypothetical protein